ncbi:hypothetical protein P280DRAFT_473592 [Massarina eburnea CBS 473.64]|uniref:Nuclear segregation protein n=1 Tax=Massarina eburnea CBS 473.64 TaxID=1395130 RepID=A0A6A6RL44_9PLEO|nr:hypothetical protein P280DRAFT_473592 [Massarina eburnea CBS 473.64]
MATAPAAATVASADTSSAADKQAFVRPEKPDEAAFKEQLSKLESAHTAAQQKFNAARQKQDLARPNNKDSPNAQRQQELKKELGELRQAQQGFKNSRNTVHDKLKRLDEQIKSRLNELKTSKGKVQYKSVEDVDREIARLQKDVDSGTMKLVDERKALSDVSNLHKIRKNFAGFDSQQKTVDDLKAEYAEQKKLLDDPEQKAISNKYNELQTELDGLKKEQDEAFSNLKGLREATDKARAEQQEKWQEMKEFKDKYYAQKRAFSDYDYQARKARNERRRQQEIEYQASKRKEVASKRLEEASGPAYQDEIYVCEGLIRHFDPSALPAKETTAESKFAAAAQRTVDSSGFKGTALPKKGGDEESYFIGGASKKGKKNKKTTPAVETKFNLNIGIIEELAKVGVDAPSSQADVPATVQKLQEKLSNWKSDQDRKTKENIAKAQKEIDRLEADETDGATDAARKPAQKNQAVNGDSVSADAELEQEKEAEADVAEELEKAKIEDA